MTAAHRPTSSSARRAAAARAVAAGRAELAAGLQPQAAVGAPVTPPAAPSRARRSTTLLALALAGATVTATAAPAAAAWLASRTASAGASSATFRYGGATTAPAPTVTALPVTGTGSTATGGLRISFPAVTLSGTATGTSPLMSRYQLVRTLTSGSSAGATSLLSCPVTPTSAGMIVCDDTSIPAGVTATYTSTAVYLRWASPASPSSATASWTAPADPKPAPPGEIRPAAPTVNAPAYVNSANVAAYTVSGSAAAGSTVTVTLTGASGSTVTASATATTSGTYSIPLDATALPQGGVTVSVSAGNTAGTSAATTASVFKDTVAPQVAYTSTTPLAAGSTFTTTNQSSQADPTLSGTAGAVAASTTTTADSSQVTVRVLDAAGGVASTGTVNRTGTPATSWTFKTSPLADAFYTVVASQTDAAGNTGTSADKSLRIEAKAATAAGVLIRNTTGTPKIVDVGDQVELTFSERINPATVVAGWDGLTAVELDVTLTHGSGKNSDAIGPWTVVGSPARQANLGSIDLGAHTYFTEGGTARASLSLVNPPTGGSVLIARFTSYPAGLAAASGGNETKLSWTPSPLVTDLAGTPAGTPVATENRTTAF